MQAEDSGGITRFSRGLLEDSVTRLFKSAGLDDDKAGTVARTLVLADMMGHITHGLALVPGYVQALETGDMAAQGSLIAFVVMLFLFAKRQDSIDRQEGVAEDV